MTARKKPKGPDKPIYSYELEKTKRRLLEKRKELSEEILNEQINPPDYKYEKKQKIKLEDNEHLGQAKNSIAKAIRQIGKNEKLTKALRIKGVALHEVPFYLAIAFEESTLDPERQRPPRFFGLFQVSQIAIDDIGQHYGDIGITSVDEVICKGKEGKEYDKAIIKNALVGILFFHLCRNHYGNAYVNAKKKEDKDKFGLIMYNLGPVNFKNLTKNIGIPKPKRYATFKTAVRKEFNKKENKNKEKITIGERSYSVKRLKNGMKYVEDIYKNTKRELVV